MEEKGGKIAIGLKEGMSLISTKVSVPGGYKAHIVVWPGLGYVHRILYVGGQGRHVTTGVRIQTSCHRVQGRHLDTGVRADILSELG